MSIKLKDAVPLDNIDGFVTWTEIFDAQARAKQITDGKKLTDEFLSNAGLKEVMKVKQLVAPSKVTDLDWKDIKTAIKNFLEPKTRLLIAERTTFMRMRQQATESIAEFAARLREQAVKCEFEKFKEHDANPAEELTRMRIIAGISDDGMRNKILERELTAQMTTEQIVDFTMQLNLVKSFVSVSGKEDPVNTQTELNIHASIRAEEGPIPSRFKATGMSRVVNNQGGRKCYRCGFSWHARLLDCRALNANCRKCGIKGHFGNMCRNKEANFLDEREEIFFVVLQNQTIVLSRWANRAQSWRWKKIRELLVQ
jgi:hypothetical protein